MTKRQRTDKSKYKHVTTGDYCTCAAYVAELMCLRIAEYKGISGLPYKFWNIKPWDWTFKKQMMLANKIIKKYGEKCLVKAVNSQELKRAFSLNHPLVEQVLIKTKESLDTIDEIQSQIKVENNIETTTTRKTSFGKKSIFNKLRELDGKNKKD
jgi:hypothetical protein